MELSTVKTNEDENIAGDIEYSHGTIESSLDYKIHMFIEQIINF